MAAQLVMRLPRPLATPVIDRMVIGRTSDAALELPDGHVSKEHATIEKTATGWRVRDLGSHNGTRLNGAVVTQAELRDGDVIGVGPFELHFEVVDEHGAEGMIVVPAGAATVRATLGLAAQGSFPEARTLDDARLRRAYARLREAWELAQRLAATTDGDAALEAAVAFALAHTGAHGAAALTLSEGRHAEPPPWTARVVRRATGLPGAPIALPRAALAQVWSMGDAVLASVDAGPANAARSLLAAPVLIGDRIAAVLVAADVASPTAFDVSDLALLAAIAQPTGAAIERADRSRA